MFELRKTLGADYSVNLDDSLRAKKTFRDLDFFKTPRYGLTRYPDDAVGDPDDPDEPGGKKKPPKDEEKEKLPEEKLLKKLLGIILRQIFRRGMPLPIFIDPRQKNDPA
jgi:hypothetical protein